MSRRSARLLGLVAGLAAIASVVGAAQASPVVASAGAVAAALIAIVVAFARGEAPAEETAALAPQEFADPFILVAGDLNLLGWNSQILPILRLTPDEVRERGRLDRLPLGQELIAACAAAIDAKTTTSLTYRRASLNSATERYYTVSVRRSGEDWLLAFHDITEFRLAERQRMDFVANVSHEIRTPLTSISGYAQTLISDLDAGRALERRFLETIQRNTDRLLLMTSDLLDLSKLDAKGSLAIEDRKEVDLRRLTEDVLEELEPSRRNKSQVIATALHAERMLGSRKYLFRILRNLCQNAIRYSPDGSRIRVSWENVENGIELRVADDGPGVPVTEQSRLFERFYRVDPGRSDRDGGSGLGLAIVKHAVLVHGGSVRVESESGEGATFICFFPL